MILKVAQPPEEGNKKIAEVLDTSVDYLIFGSFADKASEALHDADNIRYLKRLKRCQLKTKMHC
ncbi:hypothetical protein SAMN05444266_103123 [Chitinophaga jiangningensis]|uniref:HTH cro/C1-type domain-containing protein n=1 Tax=Chitinophaga jiangningensis TaxID=1419482 RepID=A0A1M7A4E3_9BACT|nr:hypothetical protein SAMN05444266_103123 [Chitinophaga jiangningensis]